MTLSRYLLLLIMLAGSPYAWAGDPSQVTSFERFSSGSMSYGPQGLPAPKHRTQKPDPLVRPSTFHVVADPQPLLATDSEATNTKATNALRDSFANLEDVAIGGASGRKPTTDAIVLASAEESISESAEKPAEESGLKLGKSSAPAEAPLRYSDNPFKQAFEWRPPTDSMTTIGSGLAIVLGLLLCVAWIIKKSMPRSARVLPGEVAEVLGRVQLGRRQTAQLIKVGRKLVLVATSPDGVAETITEIDSEADVQHLLRICEESHGRGSSAAFDEIFRQMTGEPTSPGFLGDEAPAYDPRRLAAAYANTPGGQGRG